MRIRYTYKMMIEVDNDNEELADSFIEEARRDTEIMDEVKSCEFEKLGKIKSKN